MNEQRVGAYAPLFFLVSFCVCGIILLVLSVNLSISLDKCMCNSELINWSNRIVFILGMIITTATVVSIFYNIEGIRRGLNIQNVANFYRNYGIVLAIVGIIVLGAGITMLVANYGKKEDDKNKTVDEKCPDGPCKTKTLGWIVSITVFGAIIFAISMFMIFYNQKLRGSKVQNLKKNSGVVSMAKKVGLKAQGSNQGSNQGPKPQGPNPLKLNQGPNTMVKNACTRVRKRIPSKEELEKRLQKLQKPSANTMVRSMFVVPGSEKKAASKKELAERLQKLGKATRKTRKAKKTKKSKKSRKR